MNIHFFPSFFLFFKKFQGVRSYGQTALKKSGSRHTGNELWMDIYYAARLGDCSLIDRFLQEGASKLMLCLFVECLYVCVFRFLILMDIYYAARLVIDCSLFDRFFARRSE